MIKMWDEKREGGEQKPKILRVITRLERGGVPYEVIYITANRKLNQLFEQVLATGYCKDEVDVPEDIKIIRVKNLIRDVSPLKDILAFFELIRIIRSYKPDIVHAHTSKAGLLARFAAFICGVRKIIYSPHGHIFRGYFSFHKTLFFALVEFIASFITDVIVVRTPDEEEAFGAIGCRTNFFTIPKTPVQLQKKKKENNDGIGDRNTLIELKKLAAGRYVVGTVSRLEPVKGIKYLILAFERVLHTIGSSSVFLLIVGDGSMRRELEKLAERTLAPGTFYFTGWIDNVESIYPLFDVFVVPSLNEAWGITILEAGKHSIPVVASSVGGIPYFAGGYVKLVPPANPQKIADEIINILSNKKIGKKLGRKSHELYLKYKDDIMVEKYIELYLNVLR